MADNRPTAPPAAAERPSFLKTWWVAVRPFSFPASTMPVIFGTVLAATIGGVSLNVPLFLLALLAMVLLHAGANILSDIHDFAMGLDRVPIPVSGAVVRGWLTRREALAGSLVLTCLGIALGLFLVTKVGLPLLAIGLVGILIGLFYSWGPFALKYNALGDLAVFSNFGILGALGSWTVQTGSLSWVPVIWAVPSSLLVIGILHANNWRDIPSDTGQGIRTIASSLGDRGSVFYFGFLLFGPFVYVLLLILLTNGLKLDPAMPLTFLITFLALPLALKLMRKGLARATPENEMDFVTLDGATAQLNLAFGLLAIGALVLTVIL